MTRYAILLTGLLGISATCLETAAKTPEEAEMTVMVLRSAGFSGAIEAMIGSSGDALVRGAVRLVDEDAEAGPLIPLSVHVTAADADGDGRRSLLELAITFRDLRLGSLRTAIVVPLSGEIADQGFSPVLIAFDDGQIYDGSILVVSAVDCCLPG